MGDLNEMLIEVFAKYRAEAEAKGITYLSFGLETENGRLKWRVFASAKAGKGNMVYAPLLGDAFDEAVRRELWERDVKMLAVENGDG